MKETYLLVEFDQGTRSFWRLSGSEALVVEAPNQGEVIAFNKHDKRYVSKPINMEAAKTISVRDIGESRRVVNLSKKYGVFYAANATRFENSPYRFYPGQQILDALFRKDPPGQGKLFIGGFYFDLPGAEILILYAFTEDEDEWRPPVISATSIQNLEMTLATFVKSLKAKPADSVVRLYGVSQDTAGIGAKLGAINSRDFLEFSGGVLSIAEFLRETDSIEAYPTESEWNGIPTRIMLNGLLGIVAGVALVATGINLWVNYQIKSHENAIFQANANIADLQKRNVRLIATDLVGFARRISLEESNIFPLAQKLWQPLGRILIDASPARTQYTLIVPIMKQGQKSIGEHVSPHSVNTQSRLANTLSLAPPPGCSKQVNLNGGMNEIQVEINCATADSALSMYRGD